MWLENKDISQLDIQIANDEKEKKDTDFYTKFECEREFSFVLPKHA